MCIPEISDTELGFEKFSCSSEDHFSYSFSFLFDNVHNQYYQIFVIFFFSKCPLTFVISVFFISTFLVSSLNIFQCQIPFL